MATNYQQSVGEQQPAGSGSGFRCPPDYVKTVPGILKIVEMVLCLLTFAISLGGYWSGWGGGWVEFVAMSSLVTTLIWFILHMLLAALPSILLDRPYELISYAVMAVLFLISGIVAAARAPQLPGAVGATAFFAFACVVVYGVDAFFQFRDWKSSPHQSSAPASGTAGVSSPSDVRVQY